jgi:hypothetical protein
MICWRPYTLLYLSHTLVKTLLQLWEQTLNAYLSLPKYSICSQIHESRKHWVCYQLVVHMRSSWGGDANRAGLCHGKLCSQLLTKTAQAPCILQASSLPYQLAICSSSLLHHFVVVCRDRAWCLPPQDILQLEDSWTQIHYRSLSSLLLAQIYFELSLRSSLVFLRFQIYPAKRTPKWSRKNHQL